VGGANDVHLADLGGGRYRAQWTNPASTTGGDVSLRVSATDVAGNASAEVSCGYSVIYDWHGFADPVDTGDVVNSVKAGSAVPMKFTLNGDQGTDVLAAGSPTIRFGACSPSAPVDEIEQTVTAGASGLKYDAAADQYVYVWKTDKSWTGKCGTFSLQLDDGTTHTAMFSFTK